MTLLLKIKSVFVFVQLKKKFKKAWVYKIRENSMKIVAGVEMLWLVMSLIRFTSQKKLWSQWMLTLCRSFHLPKHTSDSIYFSSATIYQDCRNVWFICIARWYKSCILFTLNIIQNDRIATTAPLLVASGFYWSIGNLLEGTLTLQQLTESPINNFFQVTFYLLYFRGYLAGIIWRKW